MATKAVTNPRVIRLIELEARGVLRPEHQQELEGYRNMGAAPKAAAGTEGERKASAFLTRALGANESYERTGVGPRSLIGQGLADGAPSILNSLPGAIGNSPQRQVADSSQDEFIAASLRQDSGAAIPNDELDRQRRIYFPMPGDGPDNIAHKAEARRRAIQGLVESGGVAVNPDQQTLAAETLKGPFPPGERPVTPRTAQRSPSTVMDPMQQLRPDDRAAYFQLERTAKTPGELIGFMADRGFAMDIQNARAILDARAKGAALGDRGVLYKPDKPIDQGDGATGSALRGLADTATFGLLDELGGVVDTLGGTKGRESVWNSDRSLQDIWSGNVAANRAILAGDEANYPVARFAGQLAGGALVPFGAGARTAGEIAKVGAIGGAAYGFGTGEGDILDRAPSAIGGGAVGALGGYAIGKSAPALGRMLSRAGRAPSAVRQEAADLMSAAGRQDVPMNAGDIRPGARNALAFLEASPGGAGPVQQSVLSGTNALEGAAARLGTGGTAQTSEAVGTMVQDAGRRAIDWSRDQKNRLYDQAERLAGPMSVRADTAVTRLNDHISELMQTPNANRGILDLLHGMRDDLTTEAGDAAPVTIGALRHLRTAMRGEIGTRNLTMTDAERRVSDIIDAASGDITNALNASNPRAAQAYRRADQFYAQRQTYIRDIIQHITGPRDTPLSGEKAYDRVMALAGPKGDRRRLVETMRALSPDEQRDVAATVATQLGRRSPDDDFSPARFVTMAEKLTPGARVAIFGPEGAEAVRDLVQLAAAKRDTGNSLNRSRSGQVANYAKMFTDVLLGAGGGAALGGGAGAMMGAAGMAGASAAARNVSARLLTNPRFVAWLGRTPRTATPAQITAHIQRLGAIAIRQPAIRGEIAHIQRLLTTDMHGATKGFAASNEREDNTKDR